MKLDQETYERVLADYQLLEEQVAARVTEIGTLYKPFFRTHGISELTKGMVYVTGYWANYESDSYSFPTAWLFVDNWRELVAAAQTKEEREKAETVRRVEEQQEAERKRQYEKLKAELWPS